MGFDGVLIVSTYPLLWTIVIIPTVSSLFLTLMCGKWEIYLREFFVEKCRRRRKANTAARSTKAYVLFLSSILLLSLYLRGRSTIIVNLARNLEPDFKHRSEESDAVGFVYDTSCVMLNYRHLVFVMRQSCSTHFANCLQKRVADARGVVIILWLHVTLMPNHWQPTTWTLFIHNIVAPVDFPISGFLRKQYDHCLTFRKELRFRGCSSFGQRANCTSRISFQPTARRTEDIYKLHVDRRDV